MRSFMIFSGVTIATFTAMLAATILALPTAFETQSAGWSAAPFHTLLVAVGNLLLAPVAWAYAIADNSSGFGLAAVAGLATVYGAAAAGLCDGISRHRKVHL